MRSGGLHNIDQIQAMNARFASKSLSIRNQLVDIEHIGMEIDEEERGNCVTVMGLNTE